jgi:hypothetical protein
LEEQYLKNDNKIPSTIFHQIDGGSENANVLYLLICYLMVMRGLCMKIVLTRLLPGHTHEDIDALFALIWNLLRDKYSLSPNEFMSQIRQAFKKLDVDVDVKDIFASPDYESWFMDSAEGGCADPLIGRFAKEEWTELQFTFERVAACARYEDGVKVTSRAYSQDEVIEIVDDPLKESISGLIPQLTTVKSFPSERDEPMLMLLKRPDHNVEIGVESFIPGSRAQTVECCEKMIRSYEHKNPIVVDAWRTWMDTTTPKTDDAEEHIATNPLYIPFKDILFNSSYCIADDPASLPYMQPTRTLEGVELPPMRTVTTNNHVIHSGNKKPTTKAKEIPPRTVVSDADGILVEGKVSAKAHIVVTTKKPRGKKKADGAETATATAPKRKKAAPKKKAKPRKKKATTTQEKSVDRPDDLADSVEVCEHVELSDSTSSGDADSDDCVESDGSGESVESVPDPVFNDGDAVRNAHNMRATITECIDGEPHRTYHIKYNDGRTDENVRGKFLRPIIAKEKRVAAPKTGTFEVVAVAADEEWETGNIKGANVIVGKRMRAATKYSK